MIGGEGDDGGGSGGGDGGRAAAIERWSGDSPRARRPMVPRQRRDVSFHEKAVGKSAQ